MFADRCLFRELALVERMKLEQTNGLLEDKNVARLLQKWRPDLCERDHIKCVLTINDLIHRIRVFYPYFPHPFIVKQLEVA